MTHICVSKLTIIGSDNGLSPSRRQAIIWTYAGILLIRPWAINVCEVLIAIYVSSSKKCIWKCRPFFSRFQCVKLFSSGFACTLMDTVWHQSDTRMRSICFMSYTSLTRLLLNIPLYVFSLCCPYFVIVLCILSFKCVMINRIVTTSLVADLSGN